MPRLHRLTGLAWAALLLLSCLLPISRAGADADAALPDDYPGLLAALPQADFSNREQIAARLQASRESGARTVLAAWLDNRLQARSSDNKLFITAERQDGALDLTDALSLKPAGQGKPDDFERIRTNNALRKALKVALAQFDLADPSARVRAAAVKQMRRELDDDTVAALRARLAAEPDRAVQREIGVALALAGLSDPDAQKRLAAVQALQGQNAADVYNALQPLAGSAEPDAAVARAAAAQLRRIDAWRDFYQALDTLFFGLSLGSVLVLSAIGLAITFGVMGVINMAHGELMMLGAYTAYVMQTLMPQHPGAALLLAIPGAFAVSGAVGVAIERGVVRFLYGRPLETLLATFGLSLVLQQLVRSIFSPLNRSVASPSWMSGLWQINDLFALTWNRVYILGFSLLVFALLRLVLNRTSLGLKVRAVAQNRGMARAMGIRSERIDALTFGLGSGVAGVAGVALSQLTNVGPNLGQSYIVDSFMVVVFGGVGNLWGTLIGGMSLGVVNKLLEPYAGAVIAKILVLLFLILFIQRRPRGLFPQKGRAAEA
jgi:urea transport system permease protein